VIADLLPFLVLARRTSSSPLLRGAGSAPDQLNWFDVALLSAGRHRQIHGALIGLAPCGDCLLPLRKLGLLDLLDVLFSVALGQAIGRLGNFFQFEAFGLPTNLPGKLSIRPSIAGAVHRMRLSSTPPSSTSRFWEPMGVLALLLDSFRTG